MEDDIFVKTFALGGAEWYPNLFPSPSSLKRYENCDWKVRRQADTIVSHFVLFESAAVAWSIFDQWKLSMLISAKLFVVYISTSSSPKNVNIDV